LPIPVLRSPFSFSSLLASTYTLRTLFPQSNATLSPSPPGLVKTPKPLLALSGPGVALRDVTLTPTYGAAVDAKGDVYLWGKSVGADEEGALRKCLVGLVSLRFVFFPADRRGLVGLDEFGRRIRVVASKGFERETIIGKTGLVVLK
jgi:hypothetical protein